MATNPVLSFFVLVESQETENNLMTIVMNLLYIQAFTKREHENIGLVAGP